MLSTILQRLLLLSVVVLTTVVTPGECIVDPNIPNIFYPFGTDQGDTVGPIQDDGYTAAISIPGVFPFFGNGKRVLYVNLNGAFTFDVAYGGYTPTPFPISGYNVIAPYWGDADVRMNGGRLYYRSSTDAGVLTRASNDVRATFSSQCLDTFRATWVFIATWYGVTYYGGSSRTPVNSYQGVLVTDGFRSFSIFNYGTLTWTTGTASGGDAATGLGGIAAQVGFNAGDGVNYYVVPDSRTNAIVNIYRQSNVGVTGRWMFRVDVAQIGPAGCILNPTSCSLSGATGLCTGTGTCSFQGDSHYVTFDGKRFNYQGICKYLVTKRNAAYTTLPNFEVYARGEQRYGQTSVAYVRYVEIVYGSDTVRLSRVGGSTWSSTQLGVINVTINGFPVSTPRCSCGSDYSIYQIGYFMRFITSFGLVVEFDGHSQVNVNVPPTYNNGKLTGICGNFDGTWTNDATECNGQSYEDTNNVDLFGDICVVPDADPDHGASCPAPPAPTDPCLTNPLSDYATRCGVLKDVGGPFANCIAQLDARVPGTSTKLYEDCILDACMSDGAEVCSNMRSLVDECANLGYQIDCYAQQTLTNCPMTCPAGSGMVFQCNPTSICHATCNNPTVSTNCTRPNKAACVCPVGTLLDNGVCTSTCFGGCVDSTGAFRQAGDSWLGPNCKLLTCRACSTCQNNFQVVESGGCQANEVCLNSRCEEPQFATCSCSGDPHCSTFDTLALINYQGTCEYLLAGVIGNNSSVVTAFNVYALNDHYFNPLYTAVAYVSRVRLVIDSAEVILERDFSNPWIPVRLSVNDVVQSIPYNLASTYTVDFAGLSVRIETTFGVVVEYDGWTKVSVLVPPSYFSKLTGICGNFDGNTLNDWTTADGTYVGDNEDKTNLLGDSFIVDSSASGCSQPAPPNPDSTTCQQYDVINDLCVNSIQSSVACRTALGSDIVNSFLEACVLDGCANSTFSACLMVSQFFDLCTQKGVTIGCLDWQRLGCGAVFADTTSGRCPTGLTYQCDAPACTATCDNPTASNTCTLPNRESCVCPTGQFLSNGECYVTCPTDCVDNGISRPFGSTWTDPTTCATKTCNACATCDLGSKVESTPCSGSCVAGICATATCSCSGDPHCSTFDTLALIDYQGTCEYLLAGVIDNNSSVVTAFNVYALNDHFFNPLYTAVAYVSRVRLVIDTEEVILERDFSNPWIPVRLSVNGEVQSIPYNLASTYTVDFAGLSVRIETTFGVVVEYDGWTKVSVLVPPFYNSQLTGLCGNFDGNTLNDWTTADGTYVGYNGDRTNLLGDSFIVESSTSGCSQPAPPNPDSTTCQQYDVINDLCVNSIQSSVACGTALGSDIVNSFLEACVLDGCANSTFSACLMVSQFFELCTQKGVTIGCLDWQSVGCGAVFADTTNGRCSPGLTYQCDAPACTATCDNPDAGETCTLRNREGCVCPDGQFLLNGECFAVCPNECVDSGDYHPFGSTWIDPTTCANKTCVACSSCDTGSKTESTPCSGSCVSGTCISAYNCDNANPCTKENLATGHYYYPSVDPNKFIQCGGFGECYVMSCKAGLVWDQAATTCR